MFGIFRSKQDRAVEAVADFLREKLASSGPLPAGTLSDPYCLGFLQMVGVHVASRLLPNGSGMDEAKAVFEQALIRLSRIRPAGQRMGNQNSYRRRDPEPRSVGQPGNLCLAPSHLREAPDNFASLDLLNRPEDLAHRIREVCRI